MITVLKHEKWGKVFEGMYDVRRNGNPWLTVGEKRDYSLYVAWSVPYPTFVSENDWKVIQEKVSQLN